MNHYKTIQNFLDNYPRQHVNFTFTDSGTTILTKNLICSAKTSNTQLVFFGLDKQSVNDLKGVCDTVDATELGYFKDRDNFKYDQSEFIRLTYSRYSICKSIIQSGRSVVYTDTDIVFKDEIEPDLLNILNKDPDCIHMQIGYARFPCTGFFALGPQYKISYLDHIINGENTDLHDQQYIHKYMKSDKMYNVKLLPRDIYPNGRWYYDNYSRIDATCKIVHFNCIGSTNKKEVTLDEQIEEKITTMKHYKCWYI